MIIPFIHSLIIAHFLLLFYASVFRMAFRFRLDDDAAAFDADDADRDVAVDERPIGHGIDAFLADADRSRRAQNGNRRPPF